MKMSPKRQISGLMLCATMLSAAPVPSVLAQRSTALEEVVVTARRREESIQVAPLAVSAFSGAALMEAGVSNLADITELVPNLQISRPARDANVYIRGVGPTRGATNVTELSVGVYLDNVFLLKPQGQLLDLADIESVQVLRGPQGTLFGKNTTGGAMLVETKKPTEEFGGYGEATIGNNSTLNAQISLNTPLSDTVLTKFTVTSVNADGGYKDPKHGTELSNDDRLGAFAQLRWLASDEITADFNLYHNRIRQNLLAQGNCEVTNPSSQVAVNKLITPATGFLELADFCAAASDSVAPFWDSDDKFKLDASLASLTVGWDISDTLSFRSITAWVYQEAPNIGSVNSFVGFPTGQSSLDDGTSTQLSQEFQLSGELMSSKLRYTAGLYYMDDDTDTGTNANWTGIDGVWGSISPQVPAGLVAAQTNYTQGGQKNENSTAAAYTQWSWDATDNLEVTAGVRYGYERRDMSTHRQKALPPDLAYASVPGAILIAGNALMPYDVFFNLSTSAVPLPLGDTVRLQADENFSSITPMVSAAYHFPDQMLSDDIDALMVYASYTKGYKAGGFSDFGIQQLTPFDEEDIWNTELGMKLDALDNRVRVNAALFSMDYSNMQLYVARPDPDPNSVSTLQGVTNAGKSTIEGAELEVSVVPNANWLINFSASLANGTFKEFQDFSFDPQTGNVVGQDRSDEDLPSLPEKTFNVSVQYRWDTSIGGVIARADAYYRDELYWGFDALNWQIPLARDAATTDSFTVFNARLSWELNELFTVTAWGKNLSDKTYYDGGVADAQNLGTANKGFAPPRTYGLDLRYTF